MFSSFSVLALLLSFPSAIIISSPSPPLLAHLPEEYLTTPEIIKYWGYTAEVHEVTTPDGYVLQLHRIPHGKKTSHSFAPFGPSRRPAFFLQHGLLASSADWVTNLPDQSIAFLLADAGFDVWMGNVRGNVYSDRHINLTRRDKLFWEFTWDQMAQYDLPAMISKALEISDQRYLYYLGHSQGTEIMFARLASDDAQGKFSKKIRKFFALAPVASVSHIRGLIAFLSRYFGRNLLAFKWVFGAHDFLPHGWISELFAQITCGYHWETPICDNVLFQIGGPETKQFNQSRLMVYMAHTPAGTSTWNILHWAQMRNSGRVQMFDFGSESSNRQHYGQPFPPSYNLSRVGVPTYLYYSESDWLADARDIRETILRQIPPQFIKKASNLAHFNHFDFIWGLQAPEQIYREIIRTAQQHEMTVRKSVD